MDIKKLTPEDYLFYKEQDIYVLNLSKVKSGDKKSTFKLTGVEALKIDVEGTCGCTATEKKVINEKEIDFTINYTSCNETFSKVVLIKENSKLIATIKVTGECQN